jgi:hypothetical protein
VTVEIQNHHRDDERHNGADEPVPLPDRHEAQRNGELRPVALRTYICFRRPMHHEVEMVVQRPFDDTSTSPQ